GVAEQLDQVLAGAGLAGQHRADPLEPGAPFLAVLRGTTVVLWHVSVGPVRPGWAAGTVYRDCGGAPSRPRGSQIRIPDPQPRQDLPLQLFHALGLTLVLVVPAEQVQDAVDGQVGVVVVERLALF